MSAPNSPQYGSDGILPQAASTPSSVGPIGGPAAASRLAWLAAAALAGLLVWGIVQWRYPFFAAPTAQVAGGRGPSAPSDEELAMAIHLAYVNATALIGLAGAIFAAALGLCEGMHRGAAKPALLTLLSGAVLGGVGGHAGGWCGQWLSGWPSLHQLGDTPRAIVLQAVCWGLTGLGIGLGLAIPLTRHRRTTAEAVTRGALGGVLSALVYPILAAVVGIVLPAGETVGLVPEAGVNRLVWLEAAAICIAVGIGGGTIRHSKNSKGL